jgi:hypothetical protein
VIWSSQACEGPGAPRLDSVRILYLESAYAGSRKPAWTRSARAPYTGHDLTALKRIIEAQAQGAAIMGLSMYLPGTAITLKDGQVEQSNFDGFAVQRITDAPEFDVHIVPSAEPPTSMGEPGLPPLAPAFANAIGRLTGKPIRQLPFNVA